MIDKSSANARFPWTAHYAEGVPSSLDVWAPPSMPAMLKWAAASFPDRAALSLGDKAWTYANMKALVARTARGLQDAGVGCCE